MLIQSPQRIEAAASPFSAPPRRRRHRLRWAIVAALAVAVAGGVGYRLLLGEAPPAYRTVAVARGDIESAVTALGNLQPKDYVDVGAQISGQLKKLHVEIGDIVKQGALLAEIDPTVYEAKVQADLAKLDDLNAQVAQQKASLELAGSQAARNQRLFLAKAVSAEEVESTAAALKIAKAKLASLQAQIDQQQSQFDEDTANLGYTKIYAPIAGTVVTKDAVEGQTLNANQSAPKIVRIADLATMTVWAQVAEADVVKIRPGTPIYFTTLGMPERRWEGAVRQILPTPEVVNDVVLYDVLIDVANPDGVLMTEMTAQVFFVLGAARGVPVVPVAALKPVSGAAAGSYTVQVMTDRGAERRLGPGGVFTRSAAQVTSGREGGAGGVPGVEPAAGSGSSTGRMRLPGL